MNQAETPQLLQAIAALRTWIETKEFAGYEPFDLLNSPYLKARWARKPLPAILLIQIGKRFGGLRLRKLLGVPVGRNPKALGLCLSAYCDLARTGQPVAERATWLKQQLIELRSPGEPHFCWGYDWDYVSFRGSRLPAFSPNSIASVFCATALLEMSQVFDDREAEDMAASTAEFLAKRLNRSFDSQDQICFSYTPRDHTLIFNSSALVGALLARVGKIRAHSEYLTLAQRAMAYLVGQQLTTGGWYYGALRRQRWVDSFHTSYNICALLDYQSATGDLSFDAPMRLAHRYYQDTFIRADGAPAYFHNQTFPIDIHACAQAILHNAAFAALDPNALEQAEKTYRFTVRHMAAPDGSFYYQRHRHFINRTPYMRWGQSWMFHALARLQRITSA